MFTPVTITLTNIKWRKEDLNLFSSTKRFPSTVTLIVNKDYVVDLMEGEPSDYLDNKILDEEGFVPESYTMHMEAR